MHDIFLEVGKFLDLPGANIFYGAVRILWLSWTQNLDISPWGWNEKNSTIVDNRNCRSRLRRRCAFLTRRDSFLDFAVLAFFSCLSVSPFCSIIFCGRVFFSSSDRATPHQVRFNLISEYIFRVRSTVGLSKKTPGTNISHWISIDSLPAQKRWSELHCVLVRFKLIKQSINW